MVKKLLISAFFVLTQGFYSLSIAQEKKIDMGTIHGSLQSDVQYTLPDSAINAVSKPEKILSNTYLQLLYKRGKFEAGARYEMYQNPLLGFDLRYTGQGIPYRFIRYNGEFIDVTVGNFYEQFGKGSVLRAYQEWTLGIDNSIDGLRVKVKPHKGIVLTGILGKQRAFWDRSKAIIRAADADFSLNQAIKAMATSKHKIAIGASVVSKYQRDDDVTLVLPENVSAFSGRLSYNFKKIHFDTEGAYKINDPDATNGFNYNPGNLIYMNASYSTHGFSANVSAKRVDNMDFRSDRLATINAQTMSFLPPITKTHTYRLPTLYPYATQPNGEFGGQLNLMKKIGDEHPWTFNINLAAVNGLDTTRLLILNAQGDTLDKGRTYSSKFLPSKEDVFFRDFNVDITKDWTDKFSQALTYIYFAYNKDVVQFSSANVEYGTIRSHTVILENSYSISDNLAIRAELQHMLIPKKDQYRDMGNWGLALLELSVSPHWYFTVFDEWNYGNPIKERRAHYFTGQFAYVKDAHRVSVGYGRQREGLLCVGGVCRVVPASNGFMLSVTSSF